MATRKDIAEYAGVSPTSVSYYINNNGYVSEEKKVRIKEAIEKLDYRPNLIARSLKSNDSKQIVYIANEIRNPFHADLAHQVTCEAQRLGYNAICCSASSADNLEENVLRICSYMVSGVFIASKQVSIETIQKIERMNIPVVTLGFDNYVFKKAKRIKTNYDDSMSFAMDELEARGRKKICYISSDRVVETSDIEIKAIAYLKQLEQRGLQLDDKLVIENISYAEIAYEQVKAKLFAQDLVPDAFICANDSVALGVLKACRERNLGIPTDVSVIAFDNTIYSQMSQPPLCSIEIDTKQMSKEAIRLLLDKDAVPTAIETTFIKRDST